MVRVAVIFMNWFEDEDCLEPLNLLDEKGYELIRVGVRKGETVKGRQGATRVRIDQALGDVSPDSFDALLIPRGYTLDEIRKAKGIVDWVENFLETGKPVWPGCSNFPPGSGTAKQMEKAAGVSVGE
jgi:protease I